MQTIKDHASEHAAKHLPVSLSLNKVVGFLCIAAFAAISVAVIVWGVQAVF